MVANNITALVLAGGRARRMGGQDKGLIMLGDKTMVQHVCDAIAPQCQRLLVNANRNHEQYAATGYQVIGDPLTDFQGPLAGMLAGLQNINTEWLITIPTDGPFVSPQYSDRMLNAIANTDTKAAVAFAEERLQPVYALLHHSLATSLQQYLENGDRKIDQWYAAIGFIQVDFSDSPRMFFNINSPDDLHKAEGQKTED